MSGGVHICWTRTTAKDVWSGNCVDCGKRTRFLSFFQPWYGWDSTCIRCGRRWSDGEWMPLPFVRQSRQKSIESAKDRWRRLPPVSENDFLADW